MQSFTPPETAGTIKITKFSLLVYNNYFNGKYLLPKMQTGHLTLPSVLLCRNLQDWFTEELLAPEFVGTHGSNNPITPFSKVVHCQGESKHNLESKFPPYFYFPFRPMCLVLSLFVGYLHSSLDFSSK